MQGKMIFLFWLLGLGYARTPQAAREHYVQRMQQAAQPALNTLHRLATEQALPLLAGVRPEQPGQERKP